MRLANLVRLAVTIALIGVVLSACGGSSTASQSSTTRRTIAGSLHQRQLESLMCSSAVARSRELSTPVSFVRVGGTPFGVSVTPDGRWAFVVGTQGRVTVMSIQAGGIPRTVRTIAMPGPAVGSALTDDGRYLLAASGSGATVVSAAGAEQGSPTAVLGTLHEPG